MRKTWNRLLHTLFIATVILSGIMGYQTSANAANPDVMEVHYMNVGQGDATLVTCGGHAMLIDAGDDTKGTAIQNYLQKQKIKSLDYLILTHPDADHIGGAPVIITKFNIDKVFVSDYEKDTKTYRKLIQALDDKRLKYMTPAVGSEYALGTATITILAPNDKYDNPNDASIACVIQNGNNRFLFTGDAGENAEKDMLDNGEKLTADVYKVGHHGSKYSSSKEFMKAVKPSYAVISCGEGNEYGHPHAEVLNKLRADGIEVFRTDESGTIVASSDGKKITFNVPASDTWKAGEPTKNTTTSKTTQSTGKTTTAKQTEDAADTSKGTGNTAVTGEAAKGTEDAAQTVQEPQKEPVAAQPAGITYVLNKNTKKFHNPDCSSVDTIKPKNREDTTKSRDEVIGAGYVPCKRCNP